MNILIVKLSAIGDVIHALPVSYVLREKYPDAHITWVVEQTAYELVKHNPCIDEIILFNKKEFKTIKGFKKNFKPLYRKLHERKYDISIDLQGLFKSAAVVLTAGAKQKIGYVDMREGSNFISKTIRGKNFKGHIVDRYLDTVIPLGCDIRNIIFPLKNTAEEIDFVDRLLNSNKIIHKKYIAFAVGTNWKNKCWTTQNFALLADMLSAYNIKVVLLGFGKSDEIKGNDIIKSAKANNIINFIGKTSLMQSAAVIKKSMAVIGGDTGNLHLAAALNISAVMMMGPTDPMRNGPYRQAHNVILAGHECDGCWKRICRKNIDCLASISAEKVWNKLKELKIIENRDDI